MEISPYAHVFVRLFPSYKQYFWKVVEPLRSGALQEEAGHCGAGFLGLVAHPHFLFSLCFLTADAMWPLPWWILSPWTSFRKLLFPLCFVKQLLKQYLYRLLKVLLSVFLTINMYLINNNSPIKILNFGLGWVFRFLSHIFYTSLIKKKASDPVIKQTQQIKIRMINHQAVKLLHLWISLEAEEGAMFSQKTMHYSEKENVFHIANRFSCKQINEFLYTFFYFKWLYEDQIQDIS